MPLFEISFFRDVTRYNTVRCRVDIEAPCEYQARRLFESGDYDSDNVDEYDEDYGDSDYGTESIRSVEEILILPPPPPERTPTNDHSFPEFVQYAHQDSTLTRERLTELARRVFGDFPPEPSGTVHPPLNPDPVRETPNP